MRNIFSFEFTIAFKDRPKVFRAVTLAALAFSLSVILVSTLARLTTPATAASEVLQRSPLNKYSDFVSSPLLPPAAYQQK